MNCTGGKGLGRDRCPASVAQGHRGDRQAALAIEAGWRVWRSEKDGLGDDTLHPGEALCPDHCGPEAVLKGTAERALEHNQLSAVLLRLDAARALLQENPTAESVGDADPEFVMCNHCGLAVEECDADKTCWGARVRVFLAPVAPPPQPGEGSGEWVIVAAHLSTEGVAYFWGPNYNGYTRLVGKAGRYTEEQAKAREVWSERMEVAVPLTEVIAASSAHVSDDDAHRWFRRRFPGSKADHERRPNGGSPMRIARSGHTLPVPTTATGKRRGQPEPNPNQRTHHDHPRHPKGSD